MIGPSGDGFLRRLEWIRGGPAAFDQVSQRSTKYDASDTQRRWEHFHQSPPDRLGPGTLVYEARQVDPAFQLRSRQPPLGSGQGDVRRRCSARRRCWSGRAGMRMAHPPAQKRQGISARLRRQRRAYPSFRCALQGRRGLVARS
ncbi:MAG: PriCT-2 domain-containing protein [Geminicoccaceae bacterium]